MDVRVQLVYRVGSRCIPVADTNAPELLRLVKKQVVNDASMLTQRAKGIDHVLATLYELDQAKLEGVLDILVPEKPEASR